MPPKPNAPSWEKFGLDRRRVDVLVSGMQRQRSSWDDHWRELADFMRPWGVCFKPGDQSKGFKRQGKIKNSAASLAIERLEAGMQAGITSPSRPYYRLLPPDPGMEDYGPVQSWYHLVEESTRMLHARSNWYQRLPPLYGDIACMGIAGLLSEEHRHDVVRYTEWPVGSFWVAASADGRIETCYREYEYTVWQLVERFGLDRVCMSSRDAYNRSEYTDTRTVCHLIMPTPVDRTSVWPFSSVWWEQDAGDEYAPLHVGGFFEFPVAFPRWVTKGESVYGKGRGEMALPDVKQLQHLEKKFGSSLDKILDPPMGAPRELRHERKSTLPGDTTYFDSPSGVRGFEPLYQVDPKVLATNDHRAQLIERIQSCFFNDLFLMVSLSADNQKTAREIVERHEEKMLLLGPVLESVHNELLEPMILRSIAAQARAGLLPPPPEEIADTPPRIEYVSIFAQAQRLIGLHAVKELAGYTASLVEVWPDAALKFDAVQSVDEVARMLGTPPSVLRSDEDVEQLLAARRQQEQAANVAAMAQPAAQAAAAAKTLSETDLARQSALSALVGGAL